VCNSLGIIALDEGTDQVRPLLSFALDEGTEDGAKLAVYYFERYRKACNAIGWTDAVTHAESSIAIAKTDCGEGFSISPDGWVKLPCNAYEFHVKNVGEEAPSAINAGMMLADSLMEAFH